MVITIIFVVISLILAGLLLALVWQYVSRKLVSSMTTTPFAGTSKVTDVLFLLRLPAMLSLPMDISTVLIEFSQDYVKQNRLSKQEVRDIELAMRELLSREPYHFGHSFRVTDYETASHAQCYLILLEIFLQSLAMEKIIGMNHALEQAEWLVKAMAQIEYDLQLKLTIDAIVQKNLTLAKHHYGLLIETTARQLLINDIERRVSHLRKLLLRLKEIMINSSEELGDDDEQLWKEFMHNNAPSLRQRIDN